MIENFLTEMNSCYDNMEQLLNEQPRKLPTPFKWLAENNDCVRNYLTFLVTPYESYHKFDSDDDMKNAWIETDQRHRKFMGSFYSRF